MSCNERPVDLLETIGNTPLIPLRRLSNKLPVTIYAKVEGYNPGHSTKDRIALYIIDKAESSGQLKPGGTVVETTSGNTGFSIAMICALKGYKCVLAVNSKCAKEKVKMLRTMGAEVHICPASVAADHPDSYYSTGRRIAENTPNSLYINQYFNELNIDAHYQTTGPELWKQSAGKVTHVYACSGTGGTISGVGRYLKEMNPEIEIIGVDAEGSLLKKYHDTGIVDTNELHYYRMEGVGKNMIPSATDFTVIDRFVKVNDCESALMARRLPLLEGLLVGYSSGAALCAVLKDLERLPSDAMPIVILPDHGSRYMSKVFDDKWMEEQEWKHQSSPVLIEILK